MPTHGLPSRLAKDKDCIFLRLRFIKMWRRMKDSIVALLSTLLLHVYVTNCVYPHVAGNVSMSFVSAAK